MNQSKYTGHFDPKNNPNSQKTDAKAAAPVASVDVPVTSKSWRVAEAAPASPAVTPAASPVASPAPMTAPAQDPTPAPVLAAANPAEKADQAMVNEGGNSVVIATPHDTTAHAVREPSALTGNLPAAPAARVDGAAGPEAPALQAKPAG